MTTTEGEPPWFVYGTLKPGQLGFEQIADLVLEPREALARDVRIWARDGLPGLVSHEGWAVKGYLLQPKPGRADDLARIMRAFEPPHLYVEVPSDNDDTTVRCMECASGEVLSVRTHFFALPDKGNATVWEASEWSLVDDPLFAVGLPVMTETIRRLDDTRGWETHTMAPGFWVDYVLVLGQYLTLCGVLERYLTLSQGSPRGDGQGGGDPAAGTKPGEVRGDPGPGRRTIFQQLSILGKSDAGRRAVEAAQPPKPPATRRRVYSSNQLESVEWRPVNVWKFWYQVRSNAIHRSKDSAYDAALVRDCARGLSVTLMALLEDYLPELAEIWAQEETAIRELVDGRISAAVRGEDNDEGETDEDDL